MEATNRLDMRDQVRAVVEPTVEAEGYRLIAVEITGDSYGDIVRLYCDSVSFGVDDCAKISRALAPLLDVEDPMTGPYRLEVTSPGIERPVQSLADFERYAGFRAKIRLMPGVERRRYAGTLRGIDNADILIEVDGAQHRVPLNQLDWAHLVLDLEEFSRIQSATPADTQLEGAKS